MASVSSTANEEKKSNRSDLSRIYTIGQAPLARLRPEKLDDVTIKKQIAIIQEVCGDVDPDQIALIHHECDYNIQNTIAKIKTGQLEDGGWQTAKSNHKKKNLATNPVTAEPQLNGHASGDTERTSPTPNARGNLETTATAAAATVAPVGRQRPDLPQQNQPPPPRNNPARRGNEPGRYPSAPMNARYPPRPYSNNAKPVPIPANSSDTVLSPKEREETSPPVSPASSTDEYDFTAGATQSLTFDNSFKATVPAATKRPTPSSIPQQPVSMHRSVQFSTAPLDIQFGDVQWKDSVPIANTPSNSSTLATSLENQQSGVQTTNTIDREFLDVTNHLAASSISSPLPTTGKVFPNNPGTMHEESTSHLSDHLIGAAQSHVPLQIGPSPSTLIESAHLPPTSTPNTSEYTSPAAQTNEPMMPNASSTSLVNGSSDANENAVSAFTPYTASGVFQPVTGEYLQATGNWSQQSPNYKTIPKPTVLHPGNYPPQAAYSLPSAPPQQYIVGAYPYAPQTLYPVIATPVEPWSAAAYESYPGYPPANYLPAYPTQQPYHPAPVQPAKYDQYPHDKEVAVHYGQAANSPLPSKDVLLASKLSATAAAFPQGASMAAASPAAAYYLNPILYTVPAYYTSPQDRSMTYASIENRDSRSGASHGGTHNRNHYHQQRTHHNSTWHSQQ